MSAKVIRKGTEVIPYLAGIWPQIYLLPTPEGNPLYQAVVLSGEDAPTHSLSHFRGSPEDIITREETPAGPVIAVTITDRADFEMITRILGHKCRLDVIPASQGACILDGLINWQRIRDHEAEFMKKAKKQGVDDPDWDSEFKRFTSDRKNYTEALILLSRGPYSAVPYAKTPFSEKEWLKHSLTIRKFHECTHFICRRLDREWIDPLWDELVADAVGIYAALGRYDQDLAELFLGIRDGRYAGGRLENYVTEEADKTPENMDRLAAKIHGILNRFSEWIGSNSFRAPWDLAVKLEEQYPLFWKKDGTAE